LPEHVTLIRCPNFLLYDEKLETPLGILYLATALEKHGILVDVADLAGLTPDQWDAVVPKDSTIYGVSATSGDWPVAQAIGRWLRKNRGQGTRVIGGAHATVMAESALMTSDYEVAVIGEGEHTFTDYCRGIVGPGLAMRVNRHVHKTGKRGLAENIDCFDFPAWHLLDKESVVSTHLVNKGKRASCITASRGCFMHCSFCDQTVNDWKWRRRSANSIDEEVDRLVGQYGVEEIRLVDEFISPKDDFLRDVCDVMAKHAIIWRTHIRADLLTMELAQKLAKSGCVELAFGVESGDQRILDHNRKGTKIADCERAIALAGAEGIRTKAYLIVGLPGETPESVQATRDFLLRVKPDKATVSTFAPYPGCDVAKRPEKYDYILDDPDYTRYWCLGLEDTDLLPPGHTSAMSGDELLTVRKDLIKMVFDLGMRHPETRDTNTLLRKRNETINYDA